MMLSITLAHDTDFTGWRDAARTLALSGVSPANVTWTVAGKSADLFVPDQSQSHLEPASGQLHVPAEFIELASSAILHRDPERFALLYRLLWRLRSERNLWRITIDDHVAQLHAMARAVHRDQHKMKAFVRFREFGRERNSRYLAWFEPAHYIVNATAPFFASRFADMEWSILTPDRCAHWNGHLLTFTEGAVKSDAPTSDPLEDMWRRYYASIFNPARLKVKAMQKEMPKKYWRNLPEASLIDPLIAQAEQITRAMIDSTPQDPRASLQRKEVPVKNAPSLISESLDALREEANDCRACPLWKDATQTVFGEGPANAKIMFVGEQPGDKEDLAGKPSVGPAGQVFERALRDAGIAREKTYVTNAVKHFKFLPRGKFRLHQKPSTPEIGACRPWYERELAAVKPSIVVAMGATAAQCVFGKVTTIGKMRSRIVDLDDGVKALVTVHPSYLLRLPDEDAKVREYQLFIKDLQLAASALRQLKDAPRTPASELSGHEVHRDPRLPDHDDQAQHHQNDERKRGDTEPPERLLECTHRDDQI